MFAVSRLGHGDGPLLEEPPLKVATDHYRNESDLWLISLDPVQPVPVGRWPTWRRLLFPDLAYGELAANANTHRVDITCSKRSVPEAGDCQLAKASSTAIAGLNNPDVIPIGCGEQRGEGMRFIQVIVVPEADVLPASLADPNVSGQ